MTPALTAPQARMLAFIAADIANYGQAPSQAEIAAHMGHRFASSTQRMLAQLERAGAIRRTPGRARSIVVL